MSYTRHNEFILALGKKIREVRKSKGMSQQKLANLANMELSQLNRIELGRINTSVSHVAVISDVLGVPAKHLFDFEIKKGKE